MQASKIILLGIVLTLIILFFYFNLISYLTLANLQLNRDALIAYFDSHSVSTTIGFTLIYILCAALSIPGATILTLTGGAIFGSVYGTIIVGIAATCGASLAFLSSRFIFRQALEKKYSQRLASFNQGVNNNAISYVLFLRVMPLIPFFMINLGLGLTRLPTYKFIPLSFIGMLPGTFIYVNAGSQVSSLTNLSDILSFKVLGAFALLGLFSLLPLGFKKLKQLKRSCQTNINVRR